MKIYSKGCYEQRSALGLQQRPSPHGRISSVLAAAHLVRQVLVDEVVESLSHLNREEGVARLVLHIASEALDQPLDKHVRAGQLGQPDRRVLDAEEFRQREVIHFVYHTVAV